MVFSALRAWLAHREQPQFHLLSSQGSVAFCLIIYICLWGKKMPTYNWISTGPRCFPHDLRSAFHIPPVLTSSLSHRFFGPAQRSLGPKHSLETRRGRAAPSHIVNSIVDQILAEKESSWWLSSLSSCEPAGILTLLVPASSFPHSSLFLQHLQLL